MRFSSFVQHTAFSNFVGQNEKWISVVRVITSMENDALPGRKCILPQLLIVSEPAQINAVIHFVVN